MKNILLLLILISLIACSSSNDSAYQSNIIIEKSKPIDTLQVPKTNIAPIKVNEIPKTKIENKSSSSSQCTGTTKKGARCSRMVEGGGYCYQHK